MFCVQVRLLTGAYRASAFNFTDVEWPPHPARLYYALYGAKYNLPPPDIYCSGLVSETRGVGSFIYVGGDGYKNKSTTPIARPQHPIIYFVWPDSSLPEGFAEKVSAITYLGHSSSMVSCRVLTELPSVQELNHWAPDPSGKFSLRWVPPNLHIEDLAPTKGKKSIASKTFSGEYVPGGYHPDGYILPHTYVSYVRNGNKSEKPLPTTWETFSITPHLHFTQGVDLAAALRAELRGCGSVPREQMCQAPSVAGHSFEQEHVAFIPLVFEEKIYGIALQIPDEDKAEVFRVLSMIDVIDTATLRNNLELGSRHFRVRLEPKTYKLDHFFKPSSVWETVTPIALGRHPGKVWTPEGRQAAADRIADRLLYDRGLEAQQIEILNTNLGLYPRFPVKKSRPRRVLVHARVTFGSPQPGPFLLDAGRYRGLGLFRRVGK